jgi:hypothetical protein
MKSTLVDETRREKVSVAALLDKMARCWLQHQEAERLKKEAEP